MMFFYRLGIGAIKMLLPFAALFSTKIKHFLATRKREIPLLRAFSFHKEQEVFWFHCASLGEYEQAKPLIANYQATKNILITFFSPSGYDIIKAQAQANVYVSFLPLESVAQTQYLIAKFKPTKVFWIKYELWLTTLSQLFQNGIKVYLVSANFDKNHFVTHFWAKNWLNLLPKFAAIFTQNASSTNVLKGLNIASHFVGDTRFDNVAILANSPFANPKIAAWKGDKKLIIIGSAWQAEETIIAKAAKELVAKNCCILIAPHNTGTAHLQQLTALLAKENHRFNLFSDEHYQENILILNSIGQLSRLYKYADMAFVGGGFRNALHNILEPLAWGVPVLTGPAIAKNWEAQEAEKAGFLKVIAEDISPKQMIDFCLNSGIEKAKILAWIAQYCHATKRVIGLVED